jgi:iron complex transport system substrate-binding protein
LPVPIREGPDDRRDVLFINSGPFKTRQVALLLLCLSLSCSNQHKTIDPSTTADVRQVIDEAGRTVTVPTKITRVIALAPNLTEIVFALGAGDWLVGNTTYCDYPPAAKQVEKVGDTLHPSIEKIVALHAQLVLVSTASQLEAFAKRLDENHIAVYVTDPHDLEGVFRSLRNLGQLLSPADSADQIINQLRARVAVVELSVSSRKPVRVFYQLSGEPLYTAGRDSFVNDLISRAGGESVTAQVPGAWPKYSAESALASKPEAIILPTGGSMGDTNSTVAEALQRSPAALRGRVYKINDDHLSRPGPRAVDGLEELAHVLHPEAFK